MNMSPRICRMGVHRIERIIPIALIALVLVSCGAGLSVDERVERAKNYLSEDELRAAVIELKSALQNKPEHREARWLLGKTYLQLGQGAAAEKELGKARDLGVSSDAVALPLARAYLLQEQYEEILDVLSGFSSGSATNRARAHGLLGRAELGLGRIEQAKEEFETALELDPQSVDARLGRARLAIQNRDWGGAEDELRDVLDGGNEGVAEAWDMLGDLERYRGDSEGALRAYSQAVEDQPHILAYRLKRALVRVALGDGEGAESDLKTLQRRTQRSPAVLFLEGLLHFKREKYDEAHSALEQALASDDEYTPARLYLGVTSFIQGRNEQAQQHLSLYLRERPDSKEAAKLLAMLYARRGEPEQAISLVRPVVEGNPNDVGALTLLGNAYLAAGDVGRGLTVLERAVEVEPDAAGSRVRLGLALMAQGDRDAGAAQLETAIELEPEWEQAEVLLFASRLQSGNADAALAFAQGLHRKRPNAALPLNLVGRAYQAKGQSGKARKAFQRALQHEPGNPAASHNLARFALEEESPARAREYYRAVLEHHPEHLLTLLSLAELEARSERTDAAVDYLERAMNAHPDALQPRVLLGRLYTRTERAAQALTVLEPARDRHGNNPIYLGVLGNAQMAQGQYGQAQQTFTKMAEIVADSAGARYKLAEAHAGLGNVEEVEGYLDQALATNPDHFQANLAMARLQLGRGTPASAESYVAKLQELRPGHPDVLGVRGTLAVASGEYEEAIRLYHRASNRQPEREKWALVLARARWGAGQQGEAIDGLEGWVDEHPDAVRARSALAEMYEARGAVEKAERAYRAILERAPDNVQALNNLAWLLRSETGNEALDYAERAAQLAPRAPQILDTLGVLLLERGEASRASQVLARATQASNSPTIRFHHAQALARTGRNDMARDALERLLAEDDAFPERDEAEALLSALRGDANARE